MTSHASHRSPTPRRRALLLVAGLLLCAAAGCRRATEPVAAHDLAGPWIPSVEASPPSPSDFFMMFLTVRGDSVTGHGYWGYAPGPRGTMAITGVVEGSAVALDIVYSSDVPTFAAYPPQHFAGDLVTPYELRGVLTEGGASRPYGYRKAVFD